MAVKRSIPSSTGTFFITFTCQQWLPLIDQTIGYDIVYNWFNHLKSKGHYINGYVIMPNHIHALISFVNTRQSINTIVGNGNRFMAYEIISRLEKSGETALLNRLSSDIEAKRKENKKQHSVWELSFDWKKCIKKEFVWQKIDYIHNNPCAGKWQLSVNAIEYVHSSTEYYLTGEPGLYEVVNFMEMEDMDYKEGRQQV